MRERSHEAQRQNGAGPFPRSRAGTAIAATPTLLSRTLCAGTLFAGTLLAGALLAEGESAFGQERERIVAVGDIHGAHDAFVELLQAAELVDEAGRWTGGRTVLVQTGDFLDRGAEVRRIMDLIMSLQEDAAAAGGEVVVLLGNHEATNLLGFRNDVHPDAYRSFADEKSQKRVEKAAKRYAKYLRERAKLRERRPPQAGPEELEEFLENHPPGYLNYVDMLLPEGRYGRWLRSLPMVAERGGVVFLHGGLSEQYLGWSIEELNLEMRQEVDLLDSCRRTLIDERVIFETSDPNEMISEGLLEISILSKRLRAATGPLRQRLVKTLEVLRGCLGYEDWFLVKEESPIWFRGFARMESDELEPLVERARRSLAAERFVVGHTPRTSGTIESRLDGRIFLIDTGMLASVYGGRASALEFIDDEVWAIYPDERVRLEPEQEGAERDESVRLGGRGDLHHGLLRGPRLEVPSGHRRSPPARRSRVWRAGPVGVVPASLQEAPSGMAAELEGPDGGPLGFASEDQIVRFLESAEAELLGTTRKGVNQPRKVRLTDGAREVDAVFRTVDLFHERFERPGRRLLPFLRDSYRFEAAAYRVSRLLGLDRVPPAVLRTLNGRRGSLQLWVHGVVDERERRERNHEPEDFTRWLEQAAERRLFDELIANVDRNLGNSLIDLDSGKVWLIDHTRSFAEIHEVEGLHRITRVPDGAFRVLESLPEEELRTSLEPILLESELSAFLSRWRRIRSHLESLISEHGEDTILFSDPPRRAA